jgi:predicted dehydrogenase
MKIGIIGCGVVSKYHIDAWKENGANKFVTCDLNPNIKTDYKNYFEMLIKEQPDGVSICTPPFNHAEIMRECMTIPNCKVLVEKPFTMNAEEAKQFIGERRISVVHNEVLTSYYFEALEAINQGTIGEVYEASIYLIDPSTDDMTKNVNHWAYKMKGGRVTESLPHPIYTAQRALGQDELTLGKLYATPFEDKPTFKHLRFDLHGTGLKVAHINIRMDGLMPTSHMTVFGSKGVLTACLIPQYFHIRLYGDYNNGKEINKTKITAPKTTRGLIIKSLLKGDPIFNTTHTYHNMLISDKIVERMTEEKT